MTKRLYIVAEGQTERDFIKNMLRPFFAARGIYDVHPRLIHTSKLGRGGHSNIEHLLNTIKPLLANKHAEDLLVTTFVDFYKFPTNLPNYEKYIALPDHESAADAMQQELSSIIQDRRFLPYIQLHEFETLLFSSPKGFSALFEDDDTSVKNLTHIVQSFANPEEINNTPEGAPSKRILKQRPTYDKVLEGNLIAEEIGIEQILERCPRFASWISRLTAMCKPSASANE